jgi:hypothetical protein
MHEATLRIFVSDSFVSQIDVPLSGTGIEQQNPILDVSPLQIDFPDTDVGQTAVAPVTITNLGNADLNVTDLRIDGGDEADFAVLGATSFILAPEQQRLVDVQFAPTARGLRTSALVVRSDGGNTDVPLSGQGRAPEVDVPLSISFGDVPVGDAQARSLLIGNRGDAPLSVSDLRLSGDAAFSITGGTPVPMVPPGGSHELELTFAPEDAGSASGSVLFSTNDPDQPSVDVTLQGQGTEALTQSTQALRFGDVRVGQTATLDVVVQNTSGAPVTLTDVFIDGAADFTVSPAGEQILGGNESQRFEVQFAPGVRGEQSAVLRMPTDLSAPSELTVDLSGRGIAPVLGVSPAEIAFGTVPVGFATDRVLTLSNDGDVPLTLDDVVLSGTTAPFAFVGDAPPGTLAPGSTADLTIQFMPAQSGSASAEVLIQSNDPQTPNRSVPLSGTGAALTDETASTTPIGAPATVQLSVPDGFDPSSARVFYRRGGERDYQSAPLTGTSPAAKAAAIFSAQIPAAFVTERGVQYYYSLSDGEQTVTLPMQNPAAQPRQIRVTFEGLNAPVSLPAEQYRQVTIPVEFPSAPSLAVLFEDDFGPYDPDVWRLLRWNVSEEQYREVPNLGEQYQVGKGFWLIAADAQTFDVGAGRSVDASAPVAVSLPTGCTQVGTPYAFPVAWSDVVIDGNAEAVEEPIAREGTETAPDGTEWVPTTVLQPWTGYFVCNRGNAATLRIPPLEASSAAKARASQPFAERLAAEGAFVVQLRAEVPARGWRDTQNFLVLQSSEASATKRSRQWSEPPAVDPAFGLSIVEQDRAYLATTRTVDATGEGHYWDLELRAAPVPEARRQRWPVTLSARTAGERPDGYRLTLLDRDDGRVVEQADGAWTVMLEADRPVRRLRVTLGTEAYTTQATMPFQEPSLETGYPNPFATATRLTYRVPDARTVRIQVFDLLGRKVRTLVQGAAQAGQHTVTWDGRDDAGRRVASGTYLCRMQAGDHVAVQSIVVAR